MNGWCINSDNVLLDYFAKTGLYTSEAEAPGACLNYCLPYMNMPGFAGMQYNGGSNIGKGYCRCYFDAGYLPSDLPQGSDFVNDNTGSGPVTGHNVQGGSTDYGQRCYSYIDYVDHCPGFNSLCTGNDLCNDYAAGILCTYMESIVRYVYVL